MIETLDIHLGGCSFRFSREAYNILDSYLNSLRQIFRLSGDEAEEIIIDIENRCAEIIIEKGDKLENIIIMPEDIKEIIDKIGNPDDFAISDGNNIITESNPDYEPKRKPEQQPPIPPKLKKRLFRSPNDRFLGGVCGGLAAYFNVDPTYVRLATIALTLLSATTVILVYVILWIIVPTARTPLQMLQLKGEFPSFKNIGKEIYSSFGKEEESYHKESLAGKFVKFCGKVSQVLTVIAGMISIPVCVWASICSIFLITMFFAIGSDGLYPLMSSLMESFNIDIPPFHQRLWILSKLACMVSVTMVTLTIAYLGLKIAGMRWRIGKHGKNIFLGIFLFVVVSSFILSKIFDIMG